MSLLGKTIVFTGTFTMTRVDATNAAESAGAKVGSSVTTNTSILVAGLGAGAEEEDDAKAKGVEIWTEDQFVAAVGGRGCAIAITRSGTVRIPATISRCVSCLVSR
jgi:NAD-dependent DNA ligase